MYRIYIGSYRIGYSIMDILGAKSCSSSFPTFAWVDGHQATFVAKQRKKAWKQELDRLPRFSHSTSGKQASLDSGFIRGVLVCFVLPTVLQGSYVFWGGEHRGKVIMGAQSAPDDTWQPEAKRVAR